MSNGFRKGQRTTDNIFIIRTIIDKYLQGKGVKYTGCLFTYRKPSIWW
jgi:hypothetical protein